MVRATVFFDDGKGGSKRQGIILSKKSGLIRIKGDDGKIEEIPVSRIFRMEVDEDA